MTDNNHPITPPDYLVKEWSSMNWQEGSQAAFAKAARWGADQELEAILTWLRIYHFNSRADALLAARRPKPQSLKEQALLAIDTAVADYRIAADVADVVRRALEQLSDNE